MCEPVTIMGMALTSFETASLAISAASTAYNFYESNKQADAAEASAKQSYDAQQAAMREQQTQINAQATDQMNERARQALVEQARIQTASGEAGVQGATIDRLFGESAFNEGSDISMIESNAASKIKQSQYQEQGLAANYQSRINSAEGSRANLFSSGLQIVGAGVSVAQHNQEDQNRINAINNATTYHHPNPIK